MFEITLRCNSETRDNLLNIVYSGGMAKVSTEEDWPEYRVRFETKYRHVIGVVAQYLIGEGKSFSLDCTED